MCQNLSKAFLIITNILFFLCGAVLLAIGILLKVDYESLLGKFDTIPIIQSIVDLLNTVKGGLDGYSSELTSILGSVGWILIGVGAFLFILGAVGLVGTCKKSKVLLRVYAIIVIIILLAETAFVIFVAVNFDKIEDDIVAILETSLEEYKGISVEISGDEQKLNLDTNAVSMAWDTIQISLKCCGVWNYTDYARLDEWKTSYNDTLTPIVPVSCCQAVTFDYFPNNLAEIDVPGIADCTLNGTDQHTEGCYVKVKNVVDDYLSIIIGVLCGIVVFEILAIVSACYIAAKVDKDDN